MDKINLIIDKIKEFAEKIDSLSFLNKTPSKKLIITVFIIAVSLVAVLSGVTVISETRDSGTETTGESEIQTVGRGQGTVG